VDSAGTYDVLVGDTAACGDWDQIMVQLDALPVVALGNDTTICAGDSISLDAGNPGSTYLWSTTATTASIWANAAGQYYVDVTDLNNCQASDTLQLSITTAFSVNLGPDTSICAGDSLLLDAMNSGTTYLWNTGATTQTLQVDSAGTYTVLVGDTAACGDWDQVMVQLDALPAVDLGPDSTVCMGDSLLLDAGNPGASYFWNTGALNPTIWVNTPGTYAVTVTDGNNCQNADTFLLAAQAPLMVSLGPDTSICPGDSLILNAGNTGQAFLWNNGATSQSLTVPAGTWSVEVGDTANCGGWDEIVVGQLVAPVVDLGADTVLCGGDSVALDAGNPGAAYSWSTGETAQSVWASTAGTYGVTVTNANMCEGMDSLVLGVIPRPVVDLGPDTSVCAGVNLTLNAQNPGGIFTWSTGETTQTISVTNTGNYSVIVGDTATCGDWDEIAVTILALPTVTINGFPANWCISDSAETLVGNPVGGVFSGAGVNGGAFDPASLGVGAGIVTYNYTDNMGCLGTDSQMVQVNALPTVALSGLADEYCESDPVVALRGQPAGGSFSGTGVMGNAFDPGLAGVGGPYILSYVWTDSNGCSNMYMDSANVVGLPSPAIAGPDQTLDGADLAQLAAVPPSIGIGSWSLLSGNGVFANSADPGSTVSDLGDGQNAFVWTVSNGICPENADTVLILLEGLVIPTGFSPNDDGKNDLLVINGIERFSTRTLQVFNRWGNLVYESAQYQNDWDGRNQSSEPLSDDTYYMVLDLGNGGQHAGYLVIKR
ncbi:MAG: gliding motility-associated C-terminal domain-containing protein, partial [Bacteroidota bacterium]